LTITNKRIELAQKAIEEARARVYDLEEGTKVGPALKYLGYAATNLKLAGHNIREADEAQRGKRA